MFLCTEGSERRQIFFASLWSQIYHLNEDLKGPWKISLFNWNELQSTLTTVWFVSKEQGGTRYVYCYWPVTQFGARVQNCAPHLQSWWLLNFRENYPFYGYPLRVIYKAKRNKKQQMQSLDTFLQEVQKQSFLTIKLPFTVVFFFCTPCRDSEMIGENAQGK